MATLTMHQVKILNLLKQAEDCVKRLEYVRMELQYLLSEQEINEAA